jgi:hypothetical protein
MKLTDYTFERGSGNLLTRIEKTPMESRDRCELVWRILSENSDRGDTQEKGGDLPKIDLRPGGDGPRQER